MSIWQTDAMGVLDRLLFWRRKTVDSDLDVEGCFTPPDQEIDACEAPSATVSDPGVDEGGR